MSHLLLDLVLALLRLLVVSGCTLAAGLAVWKALVRRPPGTAELLGPCFLLGSALLTPVGALLVVTRSLDGSMPGLILAAVTLAAVAFAGFGEFRTAMALHARGVGALCRRFPLQAAALVLLGALELLICLAPTTAWDAHTLHYGIIEKFRITGTLMAEGTGTGEMFHLGSEVLNALWFGTGGETTANVYYLVQVFSLGATVYLGVCRFASPFWGLWTALLVICLPVSVHQSVGGWADTLLIQACLWAFLAYERACDEERPLGWATMAGIAGGFAWGVKQSTPALLVPLALLALWDLIRRRERRIPALVLGVTLLLVAAPWLARTWIGTGNPLYPAMPQWTRVAVKPDVSEATGTREPLPFGFFRMFVAHVGSSLQGWGDDRIPPWIVLVLAVGLVVFAASRSRNPALTRLWISAGLAFGVSYLLFFSNARYALFAYVLCLIPAAATFGVRFGAGKGVRWLALAVGGMAFLLGGGVAAMKLKSRPDVLLGRISRDEYLARTYPHLRLLQAVRDQVREGDAALTFNGLRYHTGMIAYDADPRGPGLVVADWANRSADEVRENLKELKVRWILFPFGYQRYRGGVGLWAAQHAGKPTIGTEEAIALLHREYPEWIHSSGASYPVDPSSRLFAAAVERLRELRPWLVPAGSYDGWALYRFDYEQETGTAHAGTAVPQRRDAN